MNAELVFVGTELLLGEILNTNAKYIGEQLARLGVDVYYQQTVGDNAPRMADVLRQALLRSDVVITSGGLGPTMDDITREVAADVAGRPLILNEELLANLRGWFASRSRPMPDNNVRQCMVPEGAIVLHNDRGTAPGLIIPAPGGKAMVLLPGPPSEMRPMFDRLVVPYLTSKMGGAPLSLVSRVLRFVDIGEGSIEDRLKDLIAGQDDPSIAPYAKMGECHLRLATKALDIETGLARIAPLEAEIRTRLGQHVYGVDTTTLEQAVGNHLEAASLSLTTAESCTGGLLAKRITDVSGSSAYFAYGFTTYSNAAKTSLLGVAKETLAAHGAVSEQVAKAMAVGALHRSGADIAISISGVAGPSGGTELKPVGMVCFALAAKGTTSLPGGCWSMTIQYRGSRSDIRESAATSALAMVRRYLLGQAGFL